MPDQQVSRPSSVRVRRMSAIGHRGVVDGHQNGYMTASRPCPAGCRRRADGIGVLGRQGITGIEPQRLHTLLMVPEHTEAFEFRGTTHSVPVLVRADRKDLEFKPSTSTTCGSAVPPPAT